MSSRHTSSTFGFFSTVPQPEQGGSSKMFFQELSTKGMASPEKEHVHSILDPLLARLEEHYGVKPILYVTYRSYDLYLREGYEDYPLWCSSPMVAPFGRDWSFWQYSHSALLDGYYGTERRIDLNVFRGSEEEFRRFGLEA